MADDARSGKGAIDSSLLFIDTEFNGFGGELISLALVPLRGGRHFYEVLPCERPHAWVAQHVMPILRKSAITPSLFRSKLAAFLRITRQEAGAPITVVADWPEDIQHFCASLITGPGTMLGVGCDFTFALRTDLGTTASSIPHNALADAYALRDDYLSSLQNRATAVPRGEQRRKKP